MSNAIPPMRTLTELREFARRYTAAWCSQNAESVAAFYSVDGWLSVNDGAPAHGREAIAAVARGFMDAFPDLQVSMVKLSMSKGKPVYLWRLTGSNIGAGGTGKRVDIGGQEEWLMGADGLIAESRGQFNAAEYQRQLESGVG